MAKRVRNRRQFLTGQAAADALLELIDPPDALAGVDQRASTYLVQFGRRAMACQFQLYLNAGQYPDATAAALEALDLVESLEAQMTVYRDTSELMEINRLAGQQPVLVERRLCELLQRALELHAETSGAYDITSGPLSKVWGFYRRQGQIPQQADLDEALLCVGSDKVQIDPEQQTVRFLAEGVELNLGSIGKGYALDRCAEMMADRGIEHYLWHGGQSSVLARGTRGPSSDHNGWQVAIGDPLRPGKHLAHLRLRDRAVGTSGAATQFFRHGGRRLGHILDPRTGWPAEGVLSVTVVAPSAAEADALSTAFYCLGPDEAEAYCQRRCEVGMVMVLPSGGAKSRLLTAGIDAADLTLVEPP